MYIRAVRADDFDAVNKLMLVLNQSDKDENVDQRKAIFYKIIDDPSNHIFVGIEEETIVTTCYLNMVPTITWGPAPYALIENVVTSESHRRNGFGRQCLEHAIEYAFSNGCFKVMLLSSQRNERTRTFYKSVGLVQSKDGYAVYKEIK